MVKNSSKKNNNTTVAAKNSNSNITKQVIVAAFVIFMISGWFWFDKIQTSPANVFSAMLSNSLSTRSVTRTINQGGNGQEVLQKIHLQLGGNNSAQAIAVLNQSAQDNTTAVTTETIGTPTADYIKYKNIETSQKNTMDKPFDFSGVIDVWGKSESSGGQNEGELFSQSVLGIIPFGSFNGEAKNRLLAIIKDNNVFMIDYNNVEESRVNGRPVYSYQVSVDPVAYVTYLKEFAKLAGLNQLQDANPDDYASTGPISLELKVDVLSGQLIESNNNGRVETYSSHGVYHSVIEPVITVSLEELQTRLRNIE